MVEQLLGDLDRDVPVVWDQINDRHDTGIRAVEAYDPAATHHVVIQDDALVCRDLLAGLEQALKWVPQDVPLCCYVGKVRPFRYEIDHLVGRAKAAQASWLTMPGIYWGVAIILPTAHIDELAAWYRTAGVEVENYDRRISTWYQVRDVSAWYTWPSLVDHRDADSLVAGHGRGRHSHRFVGADSSALDVDWSGAVVDVPRAGAMDEIRQQRARQFASTNQSPPNQAVTRAAVPVA